MNRKAFIQQSSILSAGLCISPSLLAYPKIPKSLRKLTILHTNDTHSNIEPFPDNHVNYPNRGGVVRRSEIITEIKNKEKNVLLLDAGDIFQGTPYFNKYSGTLEMKLMTLMGYDCATMGNHDFDIGLEGFLNAKKHAGFDFVCSNYDFSDTILNNQTKEYKIFQKDSIKVGVFGIGVELKGLVMKSNYGNTRYQDPINSAQKIANHLKLEEECDIVICLSHLGFEYNSSKVSDKILAQSTSNIDLIIGGHTHTFLKSPEILKNQNNQLVFVNQVGWAGLIVGRIDFFLEESKRSKGYQLYPV